MNISEKEWKLFKALHEDKEQDAKTFNKPDYKGYWTSILDKYKEKAHFVYELLQNADDAQATEAIFILKSNELVFRHNGTIKFSISAPGENAHCGHINAITGIGFSSKKEEANTIGKFGVGFKSVFQYTKEPYIYDDKFWFKIEDYIVPTALNEDYLGRKEGETVFVFPFFSPIEAYKDIMERLHKLDNPILFLQNLKNVRIILPSSQELLYTKKVLYQDKEDDILHQVLEINNNQETMKIHMFTEDIEITEEDDSVKSLPICVGYFLDNNNQLDVTSNRKVSCFFPTEENFNLKCITHAPFLLVDSRQQIKEDEYNQDMKECLAELAADALVLLRDYGIRNRKNLINENIFKLIPENSWQEAIFYDAYINTIKKNALLLDSNNQYCTCQEGIISRPQSMINLLTSEQLTFLYGEKKIFLCEGIQKAFSDNVAKNILIDLGVTILNGTDLAHLISSSFMEKQGIKWAVRLYNHLEREQRNLIKINKKQQDQNNLPVFCTRPIILSADGQWLVPYLNGALNIYLPLASASTQGYNFISPEYTKNEECMEIFKDMGIKQPDAWDYIQSVILKKYQNGNAENETLLDDTEIIFDYLSKLEETSATEKIKIISDKFYLMDEKGNCNKATNMYFPSKSLKNYFGTEEKSYIDYNFYKSFIGKHSHQKFELFLKELGVMHYPKVNQVSCSMSQEERKNLNIQNYTWAHKEDWEWDGFDNWVKANMSQPDIETSKAVWKWFTVINDKKEYELATCRWKYYSVYDNDMPSTLYKDIINSAWITLKGNRVLKPSDCSLEDLLDNGYKIDQQLIKLFGIDKKEESLKELGASERVIVLYEKGKLAEKYGIESEEDLQEYANWKKMQQKHFSIQKDINAPNSEQLKDGLEPDKENSYREMMRLSTLDEMSSSHKDYHHIKDREYSSEERMIDLQEKLTEEANKILEEENKRESVSSIEKYSKKWFDTLLELEYSQSSSENSFSKKTIKINFERFDQESENVYVLSNPSRNIPIWLEEKGGIIVTFNFLNKDEISITFEVANVKDFTLRLKAKATDATLLKSISCSKLTKATIEINSPIEIIGKLKTAFEALPYSDEFNFKNGLNNNLSFVFGPPGTGKTTRLAEIISNKIKDGDCKILVLAPTNKACDVLTKKLIGKSSNYHGWLGRFVATGESDIETSGYLIDRDSKLWEEKKCCIISTIARLPYDGFESGQDQKALKDIDWDFVIIDEASMIPLVQIVFALYKINMAKFIIAGDPLQIQPIVKEGNWKDENIYTMVKLDNFEHPTTEPLPFNVERLQTQYRSVPSIGKLYSNYCYDGKLNHARKETDRVILPMGNFPSKAINFIPFRVERYDSIYGAKKLQGSNVHIYSALFIVEVCSYIAKQQTKEVRIGIICPYAAQAQLINKMLEQRSDIPEFIKISVGTIHGFQGDQCEIIFAVFNPPTGIKMAADRIMLNNKHIINVAISRSSDYLYILLPHADSYGYDYLIEINHLCAIAKEDTTNVSLANSDTIEKLILGSKNYIETNTFVTAHQLANVYTKGAAIYEVRIDENAVDIQVSSDNLPS